MTEKKKLKFGKIEFSRFTIRFYKVLNIDCAKCAVLRDL